MKQLGGQRLKKQLEDKGKRSNQRAKAKETEDRVKEE